MGYVFIQKLVTDSKDRLNASESKIIANICVTNGLFEITISIYNDRKKKLIRFSIVKSGKEKVSSRYYFFSFQNGYA